MYYQTMLTRKQHLDKEIKRLQKRIRQYPPENLICARNEKRYKWYLCDGKQTVYLPKKEKKLAEKLAEKKYLLLHLQDLVKERSAIEAYLLRAAQQPQTEKFFSEHPGFAALLSGRPISQTHAEWSQAVYEKNTSHSQHLIHRSISGHLVRSKSEALIDTILFLKQIPFRYECALYLGDTTLFPDFTIRHPKSNKIYYWEHFGLMDDADYIKNTFSKLQLCAQHGIIPSINLITTYETKEHPLDSYHIEQIVQEYFLS
ncbi:MAG: ATPase [Lachnospiraceae bacterium]|nr:ATPase [Lachnospiraceae bacterium]